MKAVFGRPWSTGPTGPAFPCPPPPPPPIKALREGARPNRDKEKEQEEKKRKEETTAEPEGDCVEDLENGQGKEESKPNAESERNDCKRYLGCDPLFHMLRARHGLVSVTAETVSV